MLDYLIDCTIFGWQLKNYQLQLLLNVELNLLNRTLLIEKLFQCARKSYSDIPLIQNGKNHNSFKDYQYFSQHVFFQKCKIN